MLQRGLDARVNLPGVGEIEGLVQAAQFAHGGVRRLGLQPVAHLMVPRQEPAGVAEAGGNHVEERGDSFFFFFFFFFFIYILLVKVRLASVTELPNSALGAKEVRLWAHADAR